MRLIARINVSVGGWSLFKNGVGDSSAVEPVPRDKQVLRGCGFESHGSPPTGPSRHRCAPTCLETESSLALHMAASPLRHCNFSVRT